MLISIDRPRNYTNALFTQRRSHTERPSNIISPETAMTENKRLVSVEYMELRPKTITFSDNLFQPLTLFDVSMDDSLFFFLYVSRVSLEVLSLFSFFLSWSVCYFFLLCDSFCPGEKELPIAFGYTPLSSFRQKKNVRSMDQLPFLLP